MRKILSTILVFISITSFGQKTYEFDYLLEYDFYWDFRSPKPIKYLYLTNSQNNEFTAVVTKKDSATLKLDFLDHKGNHSINYINAEQFYTSFDFRIKCGNVKPHTNTKKSLIKRFDFIVLKDTLISGNSLGHYILKSNRKDESAIEHYIVDISLDNHLPILRYATAFGKWEATKNLPNGIISEKYLMGRNGKKRHKLTLKNYSKINKIITIPEDCDYSK